MRYLFAALTTVAVTINAQGLPPRDEQVPVRALLADRMQTARDEPREELTCAAAAQDSALAFEVVSVKPNTGLNGGGMISSPRSGQFRVVNVSLRAIINYAYNLRDIELVGGPGWPSTERYDITATYPADASHTVDEVRGMLKRVLADRFGLCVRRETRELPIYRLLKARDDGRLGPGLTASDVDCAKWIADKKPQLIGTPPIGPNGARPACLFVTNRNFIMAGTKPLRDLALGLESIVGRPVVDATGLAGNFDILVQWSPVPGLDGRPNTPVPVSGDDVSVFTALQEQLGVKLESSRGPVDVMVIDAVRRPAAD
jgi:uncharacterized protein (TIGR03435 family)